MSARAIAAALLITSVSFPGAAAASAPVRPQPEKCDVAPGGEVSDFWAQSRLNFQRAWPVTRGKGVLVAVIDSGLNNTLQPQLKKLEVLPGVDVIAVPGYDRRDTRDCFGHGTAVTSIIAAQPSNAVPFVGVAPDVTVLPIKQTNTQGDKTGNAEGIAAGIDVALAAHADVANISVTYPGQSPQLEQSVQRAARAGMVIVAAAGNDGNGANQPAYPAAYSTKYPNVIAVSASDAQDVIAPFSETGDYVTVAAPGVKVPATAGRSGYVSLSGTSFAAPFVTGTVALVRSAFPKMTAEQVRSRIISTADAPPASVPDRFYGYGIVNPFLAVTTLRQDAAPSPASRPATPLPAPQAAQPPDRHLQQLALAAALILLGLAIVAVAGAAVLRARSRRTLPSPAAIG